MQLYCAGSGPVNSVISSVVILEIPELHAEVSAQAETLGGQGDSQLSPGGPIWQVYPMINYSQLTTSSLSLLTSQCQHGTLVGASAITYYVIALPISGTSCSSEQMRPPTSASQRELDIS